MRPATTRTTRWLVPFAASVAVVALFVGVTALTRPPPGHAGADRADRLDLGPNQPITPHLPPDQADEGRPPGEVEIIGYQASGRKLNIYYSVDVRGCAGGLQTPIVTETRRAVIVQLHRKQTYNSAQACGSLTLFDSVDLLLSRPLGGRLVRDGSRGQALVPPRESVP